MNVIRVAKRQRYTVVDRRTVNDSRLTFRARGVLVWLLDKPDGWEITREELAKQTPEGQDAMRTVLKELVTLGYLVREKRQTENGTWVTDSVLYEVPDTEGGKPPTGQPKGGFPTAGFPPSKNPKTETKTNSWEKSGRPRQKRPQDPLWDALVEALGYGPATASERGAWNGALKQLREVDASPEDIADRCAEYRKRWPKVALTPPALAKHWSELAHTNGQPRNKTCPDCGAIVGSFHHAC